MFNSLAERLDTERRLLGAILLHGLEAYEQLPDGFDAESFEDGDYRMVFKEIATSVTEKGSFNLIQIGERSLALADMVMDVTMGEVTPIGHVKMDAEKLIVHKLEPEHIHNRGAQIPQVEIVHGLPRSEYENLLQQEKQSMINAAQDLAGDNFYYAVRPNSDWYMISSRRVLIPFTKAKDAGIIIRTKDLEVSRFSVSGLKRFLDEEKDVNPADIFEQIHRHIRRHIFLKEDEAYSLLALWVMGTYVFRVFRYYPYIHLNAEKRSGKTLLMEILAPLCFNGDMSASSTEAVIYRDVQNNSPTLFLDEVESYRKEDKDRHAAIISILNSGFQRSGTARRCGGKDKDKVQTFSTYCPKMFAGINQLDDVLRDRTIRIPMMRKLPGERVERYCENRDLIRFQERLRDNLYIFGLTYGTEIGGVYQEHSGEIVGLEHLSDRELDVWTPIFLLANIVDRTRGDGKKLVTDAMDRYSRSKSRERSEEDASDNDTSRLLSAVNQMLEEIRPMDTDGSLECYEPGEVFEFFQHRDDYYWLKSKSQLTRRLRRVGFETTVRKTLGKSRRVYLVDRASVRELTERYSPVHPDSVTVTESVTEEIAQ